MTSSPAGPDDPSRRDRGEGMPGWVKGFVIVIVAAALLAVVVLLAGGTGGHGPGRHLPGEATSMGAVSSWSAGGG